MANKVFLNVSPQKKVILFDRKGNINSRFIRPYEVLEHVELVAYHFALPFEMKNIHNVFHVQMLWRYKYDRSHIIAPKEIELQPNLTYEEEPIKILAWEVKELQNKHIPLVKVLQRNHSVEDATWESQEMMQQQYFQLFDLGKNFEDQNFY